MLIIPAIDIQDGKCIRLLQGKREEVTVYSDDPVSMAKHWASHGAELLHIVDIDGAFTGLQKNAEVIAQVRKAVEIPIQLGGGIRSIDSIERLVSLGIDRVIIGTAAAESGEMFREACDRFKGKVAVGVDARDGKVAVKGWEELTGWDAIGFARHMESEGASTVIYTDISRDGMLSGPNVDAMAVMVDTLTIPVIASGGVSGIDDIRALLTIDRLHGVITGKALYAGTLDLQKAIEVAKGNK
jgi:phosphoribosylformimino-5-aminoimidazole carboxamide ribotide isomerase